ncbi:MAG: nucleoside deaminase [Oscillospiraceae bacterium]|nr:nucleoside deaminase [Oscillospiraceae bacterium]
MDLEKYMRAAVKLASEAAGAGEVPVGCVITDENDNVIATGRNRREERRSATAHAEMEAIDAACAATGDRRLTGCTLFVTLEPCPMCAGAIIASRVSRVVFGARDENTGACGSVINLFEERFGHKPAVFGGILETECSEIISGFFEKLRIKAGE